MAIGRYALELGRTIIKDTGIPPGVAAMGALGVLQGVPGDGGQGEIPKRGHGVQTPRAPRLCHRGALVQLTLVSSCFRAAFFTTRA